MSTTTTTTTTTTVTISPQSPPSPQFYSPQEPRTREVDSQEFHSIPEPEDLDISSHLSDSEREACWQHDNKIDSRYKDTIGVLRIHKISPEQVILEASKLGRSKKNNNLFFISRSDFERADTIKTFSQKPRDVFDILAEFPLVKQYYDEHIEKKQWMGSPTIMRHVHLSVRVHELLKEHKSIIWSKASACWVASD